MASGVTQEALLTVSSQRATDSGSTTPSSTTNSTIPAAEAQSTPDPEQRSPRSVWEKCSTDTLNLWVAVADRVYAHAAAIFDHAREEKPAGLGLIRYGQKSETPPCTPPDSSAQEQHQAYLLAFNSLKCECELRTQTLHFALLALPSYTGINTVLGWSRIFFPMKNAWLNSH